jgi:hypothetical protein
MKLPILPKLIVEFYVSLINNFFQLLRKPFVSLLPATWCPILVHTMLVIELVVEFVNESVVQLF